MRVTQRLPLVVKLFGIGFAVFLIMLSVVGVILADMAEVTKLNREQDRVQQVMLHATTLTTTVLDMKSGMRGYSLSGQPQFLEPYEEGKAAFPAVVEALKAKLVGQDEQELLTKVADLVALWDAEVASVQIMFRMQGDEEAVAELAASGRGQALIDSVREDIDTIVALDNARVGAIAAQVYERENVVYRNALFASLVAAIVGLGLAWLISRQLTKPIDRLIAATRQISEQGPGLQIAVTSDDEVGRLTAAFNEMSAIRSSQQMKLADQTQELQAQSEELEAQQEELMAQNEELHSQYGQLARALDLLEGEKRRMQEMLQFADAIATSNDLTRLGQRILTGLMAGAQAEVGALVILRPGSPAEVLAGVGLTESALAAGAAAERGLIGRAIAERRVLAVSHPAGELLRPVYHTEVPVQEELYLPLSFGGEPIGVVVLGRTAPSPFERETRHALELMGIQAAAALSNGLAFERIGVAYGNLDAILTSTMEGVRLVDLAGRDVIVNDQYFRLMGVEPGQALPVECEQAVARAAAAGDVTVRDSFSVNRPEPAVLLQISAPAVDRNGRRIGRVYLLRDVTREAEVDRMKTEFISTVSHELRTPLAVARGYVDLILDGDTGPITAEQAEFLTIVKQSSVRLGNMISDLLDVEKIENDRIEVERAPVALGEMVERVGQTFQVMAAEKGLSLRVAVDEAAPIVQGDAERLEQVLTNLISNAIKYTKRGGVEVRYGSWGGGHVAVHVADTGIGIPQEALGQLFSKFFRVDNQYTREVGGTGLGLAIARAIVQQHGGDIHVNSALGEGSVFTVILPVGQAF